MWIETGCQYSTGYRMPSRALCGVQGVALTAGRVIPLVPEYWVPWDRQQTMPERRPCRTARSGHFLVRTQHSWLQQDGTGRPPFPTLELEHWRQLQSKWPNTEQFRIVPHDALSSSHFLST